jgi:hypothetical protein
MTLSVHEFTIYLPALAGFRASSWSPCGCRRASSVSSSPTSQLQVLAEKSRLDRRLASRSGEEDHWDQTLAVPCVLIFG